MASRGCANDCPFCCSKLMWNRKLRYRSVQNVVDEIERDYNVYDVKEYHFYDDDFLVNRAFIREFGREILRRGLEIKFCCLSTCKSFLKYTLTFNAVGGTCSESSRPVQYAYAFGALPTPTRSGYTFLGWFTASSGGTQVSSATTMGAASRTIYAQWSRNTCTVTLSANGTGALLDYFNTSTYSYSVYQNDNTTLTTTDRKSVV